MMQCEFCGETFEVWEELRDHVKTGHDNAIMLYDDSDDLSADEIPLGKDSEE